VDTVLPISGEASCMNCHTTSDDYASVYGDTTNHRTNGPTDALSGNNPPLPVATTASDPDLGDLPPRVSLEYAADINVLRLHDLKHGQRYVSTACDAPGQNCLVTAPAPCDITAPGGNGDANCLTNKALVQNEPVVCQVCHYTPALDLAQLGPLAGPVGTIANGRNQVAHQSNSRVMHNHHGSLPNNLFPPIPPPSQNAQGVVTNQAARLDAMELSCYQCHPGTSVQCLRGVMFDAEERQAGLAKASSAFLWTTERSHVTATTSAPRSLTVEDAPPGARRYCPRRDGRQDRGPGCRPSAATPPMPTPISRRPCANPSSATS
jgi:hypothetical protein